MSGAKLKIVRTDDDGEELDISETPMGMFLAAFKEEQAFKARLMTGYEAMANKLVRHSETLESANRALMAGFEKTAASFQRMLEAQERLTSQAHERELASQESAQRQKLAEDMIADTKPLLNLVVKRLLRVPLSADDTGSSVKSFLTSLTPQQSDDFMNGKPVDFSMAQRELVLAIMQEEAEKEAAKEAASKKAKEASSSETAT